MVNEFDHCILVLLINSSPKGLQNSGLNRDSLCDAFLVAAEAMIKFIPSDLHFKYMENSKLYYQHFRLIRLFDKSVFFFVFAQGFIEMEDKQTAATFLSYYTQAAPAIR